MWDWMILAIGWGTFGVLLYFWVRWTEEERRLLGNGTGRFLE